MSRVDEAMRRAAGLGSEDGPAPDSGAVAPSIELAGAAALPMLFPVERSERRRPRESAPRPVEPGPPAAAPEAAGATAATALLERLDPLLAQKLVGAGATSVSREQYRRLAAALHHAQAANGTKVVMIASAVPGEGKTLTAMNLALTLSESYQRSVLLIDGDLRKPGLHTAFRVSNGFGLGEGLASVGERKLPVHQITPRLSLLPAGHPTPDPMAGLTSERMKRVLDEAREGFDWVVIDTPPVAVLSDANLLAAMVDAAILVVKAGSTPVDMVQRAIEAIGRDRTIGVVLNRADPGENSSGYGHYGHYYTQS